MRLGSLRVGHPHMLASHHRHAASHRADRGDPDKGAIRRGAVQAHHLELLAFQRQRVACKRLRNDDGLGRIRAELWTPDLELGVHCFLNVGDGLGRRHDLCLREGGVQRVQAEVEVRVAVADVDGGQALAGGLDLLGQLARLFGGELRVDQDGVALAFYQHGTDGEDGLLARVEHLGGEGLLHGLGVGFGGGR
ncbi:hypothetical protein SDC9_99814 [bioreactor metagenome]|uniref:Uncharacterized protein n=1 Tax=bioreactor metagenome TaxID=1076179 RepID=A0A645AIU8_9ZZZZ